MKIFLPRKTLSGGQTLVSAKITFESGKKISQPDLWFRFPQGSDPSGDPDPFAVALLLVAMQRGEKMEVEGNLSTSFLDGLKRYQETYHRWFPERFKIISIEPEGLKEEELSYENISHGKPRGIAAAFSGGVDSFYSLIGLREVLTHTLFMAGFDMPLNLTSSIAELTTSYEKLMKSLRIQFVVGSTNVRTFVNPVDWTNAHGQALLASALFFKDQWARFYIPSSYTHGSYPKWGTHPDLDPLLSTEALGFYHHGAEANRVKKLEAMVKWNEVFSRLRVCWIQDIGLRNCGRCEKCIRTMIALEILGSLRSFTTFGDPLMSAQIRGLSQRTDQSRTFSRELIKEALLRGRPGIAADLVISLFKRRLRRGIGKGNLARSTSFDKKD